MTLEDGAITSNLQLTIVRDAEARYGNGGQRKAGKNPRIFKSHVDRQLRKYIEYQV